jgi:hypothetical protein
MTDKPVPGLQPDSLMAHMRAICEIGPRPPTSDKEREAAAYVKKALDKLGLTGLEEEPFRSQTSYGWVLIPIAVAAALALPIAHFGGVGGQVAGVVIFLVGLVTMWGFQRAVPPFYQRLIARGDSQNLILRLPPEGTARRTVYLIGHLDTNKQRMMAPPPTPGLMRAMVPFSLLVALLGAASLALDLAAGREGIAWWQWVFAGVLAFSLIGLFSDERQPYIEGANDNATAVSVLLGMGEALRANPLQNTETVLLFTGCEEVPCVGMESYLKRHKPPNEDTYWIDLEMVGTGDLCYITQHGISPLTTYRPHPEMVALADQAAEKHPDLRVGPKGMLILEEVANLRRRGYRALCLAGYGEDGHLPNWHRVSDTLDKIEPDTLSRAAQFTRAMVEEIDALPG